MKLYDNLNKYINDSSRELKNEFNVIRSDKIRISGNIWDSIYENLKNANLVVADLTELNPDVFMPVVKPLVHTILTLREDAEMALSGEWNKSDEGFEAQISLIDGVLK